MVQTGSSNPLQRQQAELHDPSVVCVLCGRTRQLSANCFQKTGYPLLWGSIPHSTLQNTTQDISGMSLTDRKVLPSSSSRRSESACVNHVSMHGPVISANSAITDADRLGFMG